MIFHTSNHLFEARCPELEPDEEEIFFRHPTIPCSVNQLGITYFDDRVETSWSKAEGKWNLKFYEDGKKRERVVIGVKLVYEAYHQIDLGKGYRVIQKNGNPLDKTIENLEALGSGIKIPRWSQAGEFKYATVDYMISKTPSLKKRDINLKDYWSLAGVPLTWILIYFNHLANPHLAQRSRKSLTMRKDSKHIHHIPAIVEMRRAGNSWQTIATTLGLQRNGLRQIVVRYDLQNDI